jgi:hypothetical protein
MVVTTGLFLTGSFFFLVISGAALLFTFSDLHDNKFGQAALISFIGLCYIFMFFITVNIQNEPLNNNFLHLTDSDRYQRGTIFIKEQLLEGRYNLGEIRNIARTKQNAEVYMTVFALFCIVLGIGPTLYSSFLFNLIVTLLTIFIGMKLCDLLGISKKIKMIGCVLFSLNPVHIFLGLTFLKETFICLETTLMCYFFCRLYKKLTLFSIASLIVLALIAFFDRPWMPGIFFITGGIGFFYKKIISNSSQIRFVMARAKYLVVRSRYLYFLLFLCIIIGIVIAGLKFVNLNWALHSLWGISQVIGGGLLNSLSPIQRILFSPLLTLKCLLQPFPNILRDPILLQHDTEMIWRDSVIILSTPIQTIISLLFVIGYLLIVFNKRVSNRTEYIALGILPVVLLSTILTPNGWRLRESLGIINYLIAALALEFLIQKLGKKQLISLFLVLFVAVFGLSAQTFLQLH